MIGTAQPGGKVYLIGAGPGDPQLLTLKAANLLRLCDVIVYDYLVNPEILAHAQRGVELIYAGKRAGEHALSQAAINQIIVERALAGQQVARLKGGDPFIFGRGGEEAEALIAAGVMWEVIPGISSGFAAAAYAGIPLTHRQHASSVAFLTGHESNKSTPAINWSTTAHLADTLVIFMCAETIARIARELIAGGRPPRTPLAIIRWGTYQHQEIYTGTLADIAAPADEKVSEMAALTLEPPAIAVVGEVVSLREKLHWFGGSESVHALHSLVGTETTPAI